MMALLVIDAPELGGALPVGRPNRNESDDGYRQVVAQLNARWRIIECRDDIQWILQHAKPTKTGPRKDWRGRSYLRRRESLIRVCAASAGPIDPAALAILEALPEMFGTGATR